MQSFIVLYALKLKRDREEKEAKPHKINSGFKNYHDKSRWSEERVKRFCIRGIMVMGIIICVLIYLICF
jgi:hypothetical protein